MSVAVRNLAKKRNLLAGSGSLPDQRIRAGQFEDYRGRLSATRIGHLPDLIFESNLTSSGSYRTHQATKRLLSIPDPPGGSGCITH